MAARGMGLSVWIYSGYSYETLLKKEQAAIKGLLDTCDVLVDGPFLLVERSLELDFRGSRNQRLIDLKASRKEDRVVLWQPLAW